MIDFLLKSTLSLFVLYAVYVLLLEGEKMHQFNRFYLLCSLLFYMVIPFVTFEIQQDNQGSFTSNVLQSVVLPTLEITKSSLYNTQVFWWLYIAITSLFLGRFFLNLINIRKTLKKASIVKYENFQIALIDDVIVPHSFGSTIFINKSVYKSKKIESEILTHELTHVRQKHSLDVVFIEVLKAIFWFNPILILYKRAIQLNHEFLADENVITSHENISMYQKLLLSKSSIPYNFNLTSNLNSFLKTKKRFIMMTKTTNAQTQMLKKAIVIPVFLSLFFLGSSLTFAQEVVAPTSDKNAPENQETVYSLVEKRPEFPGGMQKFFEFVGQNYQAPKIDVKGRVFIQFVVEADGSLTNIETMRDIGHGTGEEAVRVLKLSPKWTPGEIDGKPVRVLYSLPITIVGN